ncbi:hypothetical protein pb186bvf_018391 [Paramecium bursaria]
MQQQELQQIIQIDEEYSDLNIRSNYMGDRSKNSQLINLLISCIEDNYHNIAIATHFKDTTLSPKDASQFQAYTQEFLKQKYDQSTNITHQRNYKDLKQYSRITLEISDSKFIPQIKEDNKILQSYDIIAIKPKSEKIFLQILNDVNYYDIITFDCFDKLPFIPKLNLIKVLIDRNIFFELNYSDALNDANRRRNFISSASIIVNATKGRNIIFSSDAENWLLHRSPYDLVSLGITLGLKKDQAKQSVKDNPSKVIQHATIRRAYKGIIQEAEQSEVQSFEAKKIKRKNLIIQKKIKKTQQIFQ